MDRVSFLEKELEDYKALYWHPGRCVGCQFPLPSSIPDTYEKCSNKKCKKVIQCLRKTCNSGEQVCGMCNKSGCISCQFVCSKCKRSICNACDIAMSC